MPILGFFTTLGFVKMKTPTFYKYNSTEVHLRLSSVYDKVFLKKIVNGLKLFAFFHKTVPSQMFDSVSRTTLVLL